MGSQNSRILTACAVVAVAGAAAYIMNEKLVKPQSKVDTFQVKDVVAVLDDIAASQEREKEMTRVLVDELMKTKDIAFDKVYTKVQNMNFEDPLVKHNISMSELDQLLDKMQDQDAIRVAVAKVMGIADAEPDSSPLLKDSTAQTVVDIHKFMLETLRKLGKEIEGVHVEKLDQKIATVAAQSIVASLVESKFGLNAAQIEIAVMKHFSELSSDTSFSMVNMEIQMALASLVGTDGEPKEYQGEY